MGKLANLNNVGGDGEVSKASKAAIKSDWRNFMSTGRQRIDVLSCGNGLTVRNVYAKRPVKTGFKRLRGDYLAKEAADLRRILPDQIASTASFVQQIVGTPEPAQGSGSQAWA